MAKQPENIDKYSEVSLIARGGMGAVYKATHPTLNRPVILKKLTLRGKSSFAERFRREARILMDFRHDDIVTVFDHFKQGSSYYIVMEYVEGASLEDLIKEHRYLESVVTAYVLLHSAKALGYAHQRGVVHRDIKPANILISREGSIKLADFGIAASAEEADSGLTSEGMTLGTPSYMAPEQFENSRHVDARADIYALGVMTYEMSTGKRPFSGGFSPELINAKQKGRYKNPKRLIPGIAKPLLRIIRGSMHKSRKRRYATVDPVIKRARKVLRPYNQQEVRTFLGAMVRGEKDIPLPKMRPRPGQIALRAAAGIILTALIAAGLMASTLLHPLFLGSSHGRLRLEIEVPEAFSGFGGARTEAMIFVDDADTIPLAASPRLFPLPAAKEGKFRLYTSLPLFLPSKGYRLKVLSGGDVYWSSFILPAQKMIPPISRLRSKVVHVTIPPLRQQPLRVDLQVTDAFSGEDLAGASELLVETPQGLIRVDEASQLSSGRIWRFHLRAGGYIPQTYALSLDPRETRLFLQAELLPVPAFLRIRGRSADIEIELNGSSLIEAYVPVGSEREGRYTLAPLDLNQGQPERVAIAPGTYRLQGRSRNAAGAIEFSVTSGEEIDCELVGGDDSLRIERHFD
jgi:eukaryotic-like serine/threonine-protein kinase